MRNNILLLLFFCFTSTLNAQSKKKNIEILSQKLDSLTKATDSLKQTLDNSIILFDSEVKLLNERIINCKKDSIQFINDINKINQNFDKEISNQKSQVLDLKIQLKNQSEIHSIIKKSNILLEQKLKEYKDSVETLFSELGGVKVADVNSLIRKKDGKSVVFKGFGTEPFWDLTIFTNDVLLEMPMVEINESFILLSPFNPNRISQKLMVKDAEGNIHLCEVVKEPTSDGMSEEMWDYRVEFKFLSGVGVLP